MMNLQNRVAVVTGSGRGIGRAIALAFAREGAKLVLTARTLSQVEAVCDEVSRIGAEAFAVAGDVSQKSDVMALVDNTLHRFGPPDILVNNAGVSKGRSLVIDQDEDIWREVIGINLIGTYLVTKYFLKTMIPRKTGRIITVGSVAGKSAPPFNSSYAASKHGILGLMKTLATEMGIMGTTNIRVNTICPGAVKTDMMEGEGGRFEFLSRARGISKEEAEQRTIALNIQRRMLDPEEIAELAVFLASDDGRGITGQAVTIDAGQLMY